MTHELFSGDFDDLAGGEVGCVVEEGKEDSTGRPGEFVAERVTGAFCSRETTAVRMEFFDLERL